MRLSPLQRLLQRLPNGFGDFLTCAVVALSAATLNVLDGGLVIRLPVGIAATLFVPGYALTCIAFPRRHDLRWFERGALSFALSVVAVSILALVLDRTHWGIRPEPLVACLTGFSLVAVSLAWWQRGKLSALDRPQLNGHPHWRELDAGVRRVSAVLVTVCVISVVTLTALLSFPSPPTTEFYVLGSEGLAESYPRTARAGQPISVTIGIVNRERGPAEYHLVVTDGAAILGTAGPVTLAAGERLELPCTFVPIATGRDREITIALHTPGSAEPYRRLRLWLDVQTETR